MPMRDILTRDHPIRKPLYTAIRYSAPFLKGATQTYASDAAAVSAHDPKPKEWLSGLVAGWRLWSPGRSRNYIRKAPSGKGLSSENTPPALDEVEPRSPLGDESVLYPRMAFEPLPYQGALSWIFGLSAIR